MSLPNNAMFSPPSTFPNSSPQMPQINSYGPPPVQNQTNTTRILELSKFSPDLKTRDIQGVFAEWEDDKGGFKIKWVDDTKCLIVFQDPLTAKRALLTTLSTMPSILSNPTSPSQPPAVLKPYTGLDVPSILASVQNRPRSRSNASQVGSHSRKSSSVSGINVPGANGHNRRESFGTSAGSMGRSGGMKFATGAGRGQGIPDVPPLPAHLVSANNGLPELTVATSPPPTSSTPPILPPISGSGDLGLERYSPTSESASPPRVDGSNTGPRARIGDPARRLVVGSLGGKFTGSTASGVNDVSNSLASVAISE